MPPAFSFAAPCMPPIMCIIIIIMFIGFFIMSGLMLCVICIVVPWGFVATRSELSNEPRLL
jgi:hypothetical protein